MGLTMVIGDVLGPLLNEASQRFSWTRLGVAGAVYVVLLATPFVHQPLRRMLQRPATVTTNDSAGDRCGYR